MPPFTPYTGSDNTTLTDALLASGSGIVITAGSIVLSASGQEAVNFYDGTLAPLGIGSGLLLTSGTTPGTSNTVGWFGQDNSGVSGFANGDPNIDTVVNTVFQTQSYDATTLSFDFTVTDPAATSVSFDLVFGSDEFPEWVDQFVDSAIVMVNGVNYALFNHDPNHPLSVVSANLASGYFQDNASNILPIEYDGVSHVLKIVAPIIPGTTNHIKIGIADTGDHIYDSGIFLANFAAGSIPGSGVVITPPSTGTDSSDNVTGSLKDEYFDLKAGDDTCYAGAGDDIVIAGSGNDSVYSGSGADQLKGDSGDDNLDGGADVDTAVFSGVSANYSIVDLGGSFRIIDNNTGPTSDGTDILTNVELAKFSDGLFAINAGGVLTPVSDPGLPPSNTPGSVVISGIGSVGNTLTALVSDPDGVSGAVAYQWQVSGDGGANWSDIGTDSDTYTVTNSDVGNVIQVVASYVDNGSLAEAPISASKFIQQVGEGDLLVTLIHLDAPLGASTINPLTTLVQDAIKFGLSPNMASQTVKTVLGLPNDIILQIYDAYAALQLNPNDPIALAVEKVAVEVAILTSLSDDDAGTNLTLKILEAAGNNQILDLANANDLADILGIDITGISNKNDYPQPLREIFDRHENIAQATTVDDIEAEWQDFLSLQDNVNSTSIADLSIHVNLGPTGVATASLADGFEDAPYIVSSSNLLQGFSDPENDTMSVSGLSADNGTVTDAGDGTFTVTPNADYAGPVELTYAVIDGQGGITTASQLFLITPTLACYLRGTNIATPTGERSVESLAIGDRVLTASGDARPIVWMGSRIIDCTRHPNPRSVYPVCIEAGALADGTPHQDLYVSPDHAMLLDGQLIPARLLCNGTTIRPCALRRVHYFHLELETHDILLAEGAAAESYLDTGNRSTFSESTAPQMLHPDLSTVNEQARRVSGSCAPMTTQADQIKPIWQRLAARAGASGPAFPLPTVVENPQAWLLAGGRKMKPVLATDDRYVFVLPPLTGAVQINARTVVPSDLQPWLDDRRRLGISVSRIILRSSTEVTEIPVDHPSLNEGWHDVERDGARHWRWTDESAKLSVPYDTRTIEIHRMVSTAHIVVSGSGDSRHEYERRQSCMVG